MAFWLKKDGKNEKEPKEIEGVVQGGDKKSKKMQSKRIDNLRIPQQLRVTLKSLGSQTEFPFLTKDLSATGAFVLCSDFNRYPFQLNSTILDVMVELRDTDFPDAVPIHFLAKIARIVEAHGEGSTTISGFGIRIIQMGNDTKHKLDAFVAKHGHPELIPGASDDIAVTESQEYQQQNAS